MKQPCFIMSGRFYMILQLHHRNRGCICSSSTSWPPFKATWKPERIQGATILPVCGCTLHTWPYITIWGSSYKRLALQLHPDKGGDPDKFKLMILGNELKRPTKAAHRSCQSVIGGCSLSANHQTQFLGFVFHQPVFSHVSSDWFFWQHEDCETLLWSFES